ncbi:MAG: ArsR/SmtB family transcription factor [Acidimicrobiales bacterium]
MITTVTAPTSAEGAITVLRALSDPTRLRLFLALRERERCVSDLVAAEGLAQPLVSHHLRKLAGAGLVRARRANGYILYALDPEGTAVARRLLGEILDGDTIGPSARPGGNQACCR